MTLEQLATAYFQREIPIWPLVAEIGKIADRRAAMAVARARLKASDR
jgi:hypothetical protein